MSVKKKVLVTGATGFLGSHIIAALRDHKEFETVAACRTPANLPAWFVGEVRPGDLTDPTYRQDLFSDIDVVLHVGTWATFWGHRSEEKERFFDVACDLVNLAVRHKVDRFALASTVAMVGRRSIGEVDDFATPEKSGFWPHLDYLIDLDAYMQTKATAHTNFTNMRLGHFVGRGNKLGIAPALLPRLRTYMVPWLAGGTNRLPLVSGRDMARAFVRFCEATELKPYESFNICHDDAPTMREVVNDMSTLARVPKPLFSVPFWAAYVFGGLMEFLHPVLPGKAPFLTRSLVRVSEDRKPSIEYAKQKLGFMAQDDWRDALAESVQESIEFGMPWPALGQA